MAARIPVIREAARAAGRSTFPIAGLAYILPTEDPAELAEGERLLTRYYGSLWKPFDKMVTSGSTEQVIDALRGYAAAGVDVLHLLPVSMSIRTVERLASDVLPEFHG